MDRTTSLVLLLSALFVVGTSGTALAATEPADATEPAVSAQDSASYYGCHGADGVFELCIQQFPFCVWTEILGEEYFRYAVCTF